MHDFLAGDYVRQRQQRAAQRAEEHRALAQGRAQRRLKFWSKQRRESS
jgi:hypothetical protein